MLNSQGRSIFWTLYAFFFAVPFPMLLYYMISYTGGGTRSIGLRSTPYWALAYLALSAICWGWLLTRLFRRWFILPAAERRHINQLLRSGTVRDAEVVACQAVG